MHSSADIPIGARVKILQPDYVADRIGTVLGREEVLEGQSTGRWLIQVITEDVILSLQPNEFEVLA